MGFLQQYTFEPGTVVGKLTTLEYLPGQGWKCKCICGSFIIMGSNALLANRKSHCGSIRCRLKRDIVGERFGRLVVLNEFEYRQSGGKRQVNRSYVMVQCDCGIKKFVITTALLGGDTTSCGCYKKEKINEYYGPYRESKGLEKDEYITPIIRRERASAKATGINLKILRRDGFVCKLCGCKNSTKNSLQIHHIIPISDTIINHAVPENLITLCTKCHLEKAHLGSTKMLNQELVTWLQQLIQGDHKL